MIHGFGLASAVCLFSHAKNSTYLRIPFLAGKTAEVSRLDTTAFVLFLLFSTVASIATPFYTELYYASAAGQTVFPAFRYGSNEPSMDYVRFAVEGNLVISLAAIVIYAFHRLVCLSTWLKSMSLATVGFLYFAVVCMLPMLFSVFMDFGELRDVQVFGITLSETIAPTGMMISPFTMMMVLFNEMSSRFPNDAPAASFYVAHFCLLGWALLGIRRSGRKLREQYPIATQKETN